MAIIGLCVAVATLVWQWRSWLYEGPRIKVTCTGGFAVPGTPREQLWMVEATNVGRSPIKLVNWGFDIPGYGAVVDQTNSLSPTRLPTTLNGGHSSMFMMPKSSLLASLDGAGRTDKSVRAFVTTPVHGRVFAKAITIRD